MNKFIAWIKNNIVAAVIIMICLVVIVGYTVYEQSLDQSQATTNVRNVTITVVHVERVNYISGPFGIHNRSLYLVYGYDEKDIYRTYELVDTEERQNTSDWYGELAGNLNMYGPVQYNFTITGKRIYSQSMYPNIIDYKPGSPESLTDEGDTSG